MAFILCLYVCFMCLFMCLFMCVFMCVHVIHAVCMKLEGSASCTDVVVIRGTHDTSIAAAAAAAAAALLLRTIDYHNDRITNYYRLLI